MAIPVSHAFSGASRPSRRGCALAVLAIALGGCSINLGSLLPEPDNTAPKAAAAANTNPDRSGGSVNDSQAAAGRGQALARSGKTDEALAEFNAAIVLDPNNAQALYSRGTLYQAQKQHQLAVDDFTAANGLMPQRFEPLLARAISYLALDRIKEAVADLDEAVQAEPQNGQVWVTRGLAYERLGDKTKAAESYGRALSIRPRDEAARSGFARVGGKAG